ncbi:MAG: universal stress protein [Nocardioidaceae bacterium]
MTGQGASGDYRIVVGVDGSPGSVLALEWAVREAGQRGATAHAVMAWEHPQPYAANVWGLGMDPALDIQEALASAAAAEAARIAGEVGEAQDMVVTSAAFEGHPATALLQAAQDADLLVVGSRGHGGFVGALLGSVSQHVVCHASCPVVVVPDADRHHS